MKKKEKLFREIMKQKYFEWQDANDSEYRAVCCSNYCVCEDIAKEVFGWTDHQVEVNEDRWRKQWRIQNEE